MKPTYKLHTDPKNLNINELKELNEKVGSRPRLIEKWERALSFSPYVAYIYNGDQLIAFSRVETGGPNLLIYDMCVDPTYQGQGLGTVVLTSLLEQAELDGVPVIGLSAWTPMARKFYLKNGFSDSTRNTEIENYMEIEL